jgi:RalA-binding protein 1
MNMNMGGQRKGSNGSSASSSQRLREDLRTNPMMVREETAFD